LSTYMKVYKVGDIVDVKVRSGTEWCGELKTYWIVLDGYWFQHYSSLPI